MSEEVSQEQPPRPIAHLVSRRSVEEDRAWAQLYAAIHQPSAAEEVVKQLDADAQSTWRCTSGPRPPCASRR
jgi:hypothetical protein